MIEFFILSALYKKLAAIAEEKHRTRSWGWLGISFWLLGEVLGFVVVGVDGGGESYVAALVFALIGAGAAYVAVKSLATLPPPGFPTATIHMD